MTVATRVRMASRTTTAAFNPLTQVTALHAVWAGDPSWSTGKPADGGTVTAMRNQSGGGDPANIGTPIYRASAASLGNKPAVEFDGVDDALVVDVADQAQTFKVVVVGRWTSNPSTANTMIGFGAGTAHGVDLVVANRFQISNGTALTVASGTLGTAGHVWRVTCNNTSSEAWQDGTSILTGTTGTGAFSWFKLGCDGQTTTHNRFAPVQIAFCGIYAGATSDSALATLAADLKSHYGL